MFRKIKDIIIKTMKNIVSMLLELFSILLTISDLFNSNNLSQNSGMDVLLKEAQTASKIFFDFHEP